MIGILSQTTDTAFNLATEEYLLRNTELDAFFLYVNQPSIIVGKHQNTLAEINFEFTQNHNIPVYRRLSGGGTVYHDLQNLNFCFIKSGEKSQLVNFALYSKPILEALNSLGINAHFGKRHDIQIDNKKISGNASHVYKNRVMHHGTLLFNSDLNILNNCLKTNPLLYKDKAVKSIRSEVTNISNYTISLDFDKFKTFIFNFLLNYFNDCREIKMDHITSEEIKKLVKTKYSTDEWNFGYSPSYSFKKRVRLNNGIRLVNSINVVKGKIIECNITASDKNLNSLLSKISDELKGVVHTKYNLNIYFDNIIKLQHLPFDKTEWIQLFF